MLRQQVFRLSAVVLEAAQQQVQLPRQPRASVPRQQVQRAPQPRASVPQQQVQRPRQPRASVPQPQVSPAHCPAGLALPAWVSPGLQRIVCTSRRPLRFPGPFSPVRSPAQGVRSEPAGPTLIFLPGNAAWATCRTRGARCRSQDPRPLLAHSARPAQRLSVPDLVPGSQPDPPVPVPAPLQGAQSRRPSPPGRPASRARSWPEKGQAGREARYRRGGSRSNSR